jgi:hypothetical protein
MGRDLNVSEESVNTAVSSLQNPSPFFPPRPYISARVVTRQVMTAMTLIYKELLRDVLEGLETESKSKTPTSSAISFCTNLILGFIVEELETVFDGLVIYRIYEEGEDPVRTARSGTECRQLLEDVLKHYSWATFFNNHQRYNLIKDGCPIDDAWGQNQGVAGLADDIGKILRDFGNTHRWPLQMAANASQRMK